MSLSPQRGRRAAWYSVIPRGRLAGALLLLCAARAAGQSAPTTTAPAGRGDDTRCLNCHGQAHITRLSEADRLTMVTPAPAGQARARSDASGLLVDVAARQNDVHREVACTACHVDAQTLPHAAVLRPAQCSACHVQPAADVLQSAHAAAALRPGVRAPVCGDCHGSHDIRPRSDPKSRIYPQNSIHICGDCHARHAAAPGSHDGAGQVSRYLDSVHGRAIARAGLVVAATCADCHGHHDIRPAKDPRSTVHHDHVVTTCGRCHVGIESAFADSVHATAKADPRSRRQPPVCNDCHSAHAITRADAPGFLRDITAECGTCHSELYRTYRMSYHGQVEALGGGRVARCSDCHGAHNIRPPSDPASSLSTANIANTCGRCHVQLKNAAPAVRANFVRYAPHADYRDRQAHPVLYYIWLYFMVVMGITFGFWGLHSILWYLRDGIQARRDGPRPPHAPATFEYRRFRAWHRWTHVLVIVSFFGLTLTGLPLKFNDHPWSRGFMRAVGGARAAGVLHRCFALMVLAYLVMHVIHLWTQRRGDGRTTLMQRVFGPNSLVPNAADWRQFTAMVRWFLGRGARPAFDRWTYWEKFDYWADLFGTGIIGLSGLLLWFPEVFSNFLSGYWFNVATVVHGYEALLAAGFIFSIHFFNAHLRRDKFPVDRVIFTGRITEEEFRAERPLQWERLTASGDLEQLRVRPAPRWIGRAATVVGVLALLVGYLLIGLIIGAGLN
ncbi:MAG: cytochrome c3 family protein [Phycisphaerae bacterium]